MKETINQRIKKYRKMLNYKQKDVADRLGMKLSTYSQMERSGKINSELLIPFAQILEIDVTTLVYGESREKPQEKMPEPEVPKPEPEPQKPIQPQPITFDNLNSREFSIVTMFRNMSEPNKTLLFEFVCRFFEEKDFKKVIKIMNPKV